MMKALVISSSPRRDGNSFLMAEKAGEGLLAAGIEAEVIVLADYLAHFLQDCRTCRGTDQHCTLPDQYETLFMEKFLPAQGVIFATPLYWYGMSAQLKAFFDRTFCYCADSSPHAQKVVPQYMGKRYGLLLSSEETYPTAPHGVIHSIQEFSRYTRSAFVGSVQGIGNQRGEVRSDPADPLTKAYQLGYTLMARPYSDYYLDSPRGSAVWKK